MGANGDIRSEIDVRDKQTIERTSRKGLFEGDFYIVLRIKPTKAESFMWTILKFKGF